MTQNAFLQLLRQYAALSQRTGKSYAEAVNAIAAARYEAISKRSVSKDMHDGLVSDLDQQLQREYGRVDRTFVADYDMTKE